MEVLFSPFVRQTVELSADLCGDIDSGEVAPSGDCGLQRGKPKPKARMDAYHINRGVFNFAATTVHVPLKARGVKEKEAVAVLASSLQCFEQDFHVLTMMVSFLDCSGATSTRES